MVHYSFGRFAQKLRNKMGLGLREAAKLMQVSPAYLSQVERDIDAPKSRLMAAMSKHYGTPTSEIEEAARRARVEYRRPQSPARTIEELAALYRLGGGVFTSAEVEEMIRHTLEKRGEAADEIERVISLLRNELPRISEGGRDALFAADVKPRFLSKRAICLSAEAVLVRNELNQGNYNPPTPIELLVEKEGIVYTIEDLPGRHGGAVVLGRTRWNGADREITINAELAESERECDWHRLRFTLAHELFHAIEHLPLMGGLRQGGMARMALLEVGILRGAERKRRSPAERAVDRWVTSNPSRGLVTREDWREWQANVFASAVLMPEWAVTAAFQMRASTACICAPPSQNPREFALEIAGEILFRGRVFLKSLAQTFEVSRQAMAIRLLDLRLVREVERQ
jgi:Zn-dependent peptidase ImmA (M78 family)/transcriptional regulator with XRE-family HTH domain